MSRTLRSWMTMFIRPSAFFSLSPLPPLSRSAIEILLRMARYSACCRADSAHAHTTSRFAAISLSTSALTRRSMNGRSTCRRHRRRCRRLAGRRPPRCCGACTAAENQQEHCRRTRRR